MKITAKYVPQSEHDAVLAERDALKDCRLCDHFTRAPGGCMSTVQCINVSQLTISKARIRRLWKEVEG